MVDGVWTSYLTYIMQGLYQLSLPHKDRHIYI